MSCRTTTGPRVFHNLAGCTVGGQAIRVEDFFGMSLNSSRRGEKVEWWFIREDGINSSSHYRYNFPAYPLLLLDKLTNIHTYSIMKLSYVLYSCSVLLKALGQSIICVFSVQAIISQSQCYKSFIEDFDISFEPNWPKKDVTFLSGEMRNRYIYVRVVYFLYKCLCS